jgi:hypothetical protein
MAQHDVKIEILMYLNGGTAGSGSTTTQIKFTDHGLETGDFIVNTMRRTTSQKIAERGSRKIIKVDSNTVSHSIIAGQTEDDGINLFHFTDISTNVLQQSFKLNKKTNGEYDCSFDVEVANTEGTLEYNIYAGQYVKVYIDDDVKFSGVIDTVDRVQLSKLENKLLFSLSVTNLKNVCYRRTIKINYETDDLTDEIIEDMVDSYLYQEGIEKGTISAGIALGADWVDIISIGDLIDECAAKNGFQWFVDCDFKLQFYDNPSSIPASVYNLDDDDESFTDYQNVKISESIDNYVNKIICVGNMDNNGNTIYTIRGDTRNTDMVFQKNNKQNTMQYRCAGTGVFGYVYRDSGLEEYTEAIAAAGTDEDSIVLTTHDLEPGDFIYNLTRNAVTFVIYVGASSIDVETISGQTAGDTIIWYPSANIISNNILKKQGITPRTIQFDTEEIGFEPGTKMLVKLADMGITSDTYWNIDEVSITSTGNKYFKCHVNAVLRDNDEFSTQKNPKGVEFFKGI